MFNPEFENKLRRALREAASMDYIGNGSNTGSFSTSGSFYDDDDDFLTPIPPPDPNVATLEEKKKIYNALRLQELVAVALHLGWSANQINPYRVKFDGVDPNSNDVGKPDRLELTDNLRKFLRQDKDVKNKLRSKIDKKEILEICEAAYDTAVKLTLKNARKLKITKASIKIRQCAQEFRKKICSSVATSLSNRRELSSWQKTKNNTAALKAFGKLLANPFSAMDMDEIQYPYPEDY